MPTLSVFPVHPQIRLHQPDLSARLALQGHRQRETKYTLRTDGCCQPPRWLSPGCNFDDEQGDHSMGVTTAGELQSGNVVIVEKNPLVVLKRQTTKSGRNAAVVKLRAKNLMTNRIVESVMKADDKMETVILDRKECTYSYYAAPNHVFIDSEYNQYEVDSEMISDLEKYLMPDTNEICEVTFYEGRPISVVLPKIIIREVEYTEPAARGDTSGKITKAAVLKGTKHEIQVAAFIEIGDKIEIDTETGEFRRRCA